MDQTRFIEEVRAQVGAANEDDVEKAVRATIAALGAMVGHPHRQAIAGALPEALARPFRDAHYDASMGRDAFVEQVAASEHVPQGRALEHATAVLAALGGALEEDVRLVLEGELPEDVREWVRPKRESRPPPRAPARGHPARGHQEPPHRLSDGEAGSRHPISESAPHRAHADSVAATPSPHADTKLSSARGTTQEREHETLSEGSAGSERPVSETE